MALTKPDRQPTTAVILAALNIEHRAVRAYLTDLTAHTHPAGTVFDVGRLHGTPWRIVLATTGEGNVSTAVLAERAITAFTPAAVLFVGVAGALKHEIELGDIVVATRVYGYHSGKEEEGQFLARPRSWEIAHDLDQVARYVERTRSWLRLLPRERRKAPPIVHF